MANLVQQAITNYLGPPGVGVADRALESQLQRAGLQSFETWQNLIKHPDTVARVLGDIVSKGCQTDTLVLYVDQMEELFAGGSDSKDSPTALLTGLYEATRQSAPAGVRAAAAVRAG